ncbi:MAG: hypothetical protein P4M07_22610 [Xanthobacteraceae bacterium]|nr:hypothetical protein [Xanthobacteraceae bacterium]
MSVVDQSISPLDLRPARLDAGSADPSTGGVLVFCAINAALAVLGALFQWLGLPPPLF